LLLLALWLWWSASRDGVPAATPARAATPAAAERAALAVTPTAGPAPAAVTREIPAVALVALRQEQPEPVDTGRDPFRFGAARPRSDERPPSPPPVAVGTRPSGMPGATPEPAAPTGPPPPPPIQLKYIGMAKQGSGGKLIAVLRDDNGIYHGAEGDIVEGQFRIVRVTAETVEVAYVDGRGRRVIPLAGRQP
jgi:hypothetical protein